MTICAAPVRLQLSRRKGFRLQEHSRATNGLDAVSVARPSRFGNPYQIGQCDPNFINVNRVMISNADLVAAFRQYILRCLETSDDWLCKLRGKNLACWCKLGECCHADVLLELANNAAAELEHE